MNSSIFKPRNAILILLIFSMGLYYHTMNAELLSLDDFTMMYNYNNNTPDFKYIFFPAIIDFYYRPVALSSFLIDYLIWRDHGSGFHLTNMIFHSANVMLVYILCLLLIKGQVTVPLNKRGEGVVSFFAAFLFAVHPINTEAVNFISGRTDIMATFFVLISFLLFLYYKKSSLIPRPSSLVFLFLSVLTYFMAILSKEVALTFPLIIMVYEYFLGSPQSSALSPWQSLQPFNKVRVKSSLIGLIIFVIPTIIYFYLRSIGLSEGDISVGRTIGIMDRISINMFFNFTASAGFYFKKLIYPFPLNLAIIQINKGIYFFIGAIFLVSLLVLGLKVCKVSVVRIQNIANNKNLLSTAYCLLLTFCLWSVFIFTLPAIAISIAPTAWTPYAERYLYLPSVFFCVFFSFQLSSLVPRPSLLIIMIAIALVFSVATYKRNILWLNNLTIWEDTVKKSPNFGNVYNEYGIALMTQGEDKKAEEQFLKAIALGFKAKSFYNLAVIAKKNNDLELAEKYFKEGIKITPVAGAYRRLASVYLAKAGKKRKGNYFQKAIECFEKAYQMDRDLFSALRLGSLYCQVGRYDDAKTILQDAIRNNPGSYIEGPARRILNKIKESEQRHDISTDYTD